MKEDQDQEQDRGLEEDQELIQNKKIFLMKNFLLIITIASITIFCFSKVPKTKEKEKAVKKTISFSFVGDLMCHAPQFESARVSADSFDFNPVFNDIKEILSEADFTIGNLETVTAGKEFRFTGYPIFNTPTEYLYALKNSGFDLLITSNNHSLDRGIKGVYQTIKNIRAAGLNCFGTNFSKQERDSILIIEKNKIKIALLAYTYGLNGNYLPKEKSYAVNLIDTTLIKKDILKAKSKNVDATIVYFHFGEEYQRQSNKYQKQIAEKTFGYGADIIIASHPHVIQELEFVNNPSSSLEKSFVAYSLGNFLSNQRWRYSDCGVVLNFTLLKNESNEIILDTISAEPTWVAKEIRNGKTSFSILPADTSKHKNFKRLSPTDQRKLIESYLDTKEKLSAVYSFRRKNSSHKN